MKLFIITGTCGSGKSTMKDKLAARLNPARYACVDSDETGLNWWTMQAPNGKDSTVRTH